MRKSIYLIYCLLVITGGAYAQTPPQLTLRDAVELALKNNFDIRISQNSAAIANNNVTLGNAGILPQVTADFTSSNSILTTRQTRADGTINNINNARNTGITYGANLNWTIFDGFAMFANYDQLKEQDKLGQLSLKDTVQRTIADVIITYYNLISQADQIKALDGVLAISRTQAKYAGDKFKVGAVSRLEVNTALVNANIDTSNLIDQYRIFRETKVRLNQLLGRNVQTDFTVADTIIVDESLKLGDVINNAQTQNPAILAAQINRSLAEINLRQVKSTRYPQLSVASGYTISDSRNPAGFARVQNAKGFNYGLTASINIFDGFNQWRRERNAKLQIDNAGLNYKQVQQVVEATISNFFISYISGLEQVKIGQTNKDLAKRNLDLSLERYRLGNITPLEIREAQRNYLDAQSRFSMAQYQAKMAEVTLRQITNSIDIK
ncbi:TolC family protein [Mucilaginibacter hurinus]|uniref:TolC family protein n=1 Tax=Mucilaginibacter hurinus TaxID=2201324 RepID=A0A367GJH2_9SPHI|nr:TolC family protein [Mucilaginibacter hurinus]RCH53619.1 TolC family protein [Mucilaginibacter hurinus]